MNKKNKERVMIRIEDFFMKVIMLMVNLKEMAILNEDRSYYIGEFSNDLANGKG